MFHAVSERNIYSKIQLFKTEYLFIQFHFLPSSFNFLVTEMVT